MDGSCPWSVVHKSQLPEELSFIVRFEVSVVSFNDFGAVEFTFGDDVKDIADLSFSDDKLIGLSLDLVHGINNDLLVFVIEALEKD